MMSRLKEKPLAIQKALETWHLFLFFADHFGLQAGIRIQIHWSN
jgi:hypothetical protein